MKKNIIVFMGLLLTFISCNKNDDEPVDNETEMEQAQEEPTIDLADIVVQNFMWQTMNDYYLFQGDVNDLADDRFATESDYIDFLTANPDPETFLTEKLLFSGDRFTFFSEDYRDLTNFLSGISKSNGLEFGLSLIGDTDEVFGFVQYVIKNSDAASKDIKRGDYFIGVNGTRLNRNNYIELLFGDNDTYTLDMADIGNGSITPNEKEVTLTKQENLLEDPILVNTVINQGDRRVGYLMYNQFQAGSGEALNRVFGEFKNQNVTDLVLDLRYNGGGRGTTAQILASLIYGTNTDQLFYTTSFNAKILALFEPGELDNNFVASTGNANGNSNSALNTLNLNTVYILATDSSASASELVMVGLEPYVDVVHIGTTTFGKNQGSFTFVDDPENDYFYDQGREDQINPDNQWALQPIVSTVENSAGFSDYSSGLVPDFELEEDITNLGTFGDPSEPLLARALAEINGSSARQDFTVNMPANILTSSKLFDERKSILVLDRPVKTNTNN